MQQSSRGAPWTGYVLFIETTIKEIICFKRDDQIQESGVGAPWIEDSYLHIEKYNKMICFMGVARSRNLTLEPLGLNIATFIKRSVREMTWVQEG